MISVLRLTPMNSSTRINTIKSVRELRDVLSGGPDLPADMFFDAALKTTPELRAKLGERHAQILSDARRAERARAEGFRRDLLLRLKGRLPSLADAMDAVGAGGDREKTQRRVAALKDLARSQTMAPENIVATAVVVEPLLRALAPEDSARLSIYDRLNAWTGWLVTGWPCANCETTTSGSA